MLHVAQSLRLSSSHCATAVLAIFTVLEPLLLADHGDDADEVIAAFLGTNKNAAAAAAAIDADTRASVEAAFAPANFMPLAYSLQLDGADLRQVEVEARRLLSQEMGNDGVMVGADVLLLRNVCSGHNSGGSNGLPSRLCMHLAPPPPAAAVLLRTPLHSAPTADACNGKEAEQEVKAIAVAAVEAAAGAIASVTDRVRGWWRGF